MAFPTIPTGGRILTGVQANATATRTFPAFSGLTQNTGDLLIAIIIAYQSSVTNAAYSSWSNGFTEFRDSSTATTLALGCAYKWVGGSAETGSLTVTQAATITGHACFILMSIPDAHASTPPETGGLLNGTTSAPNATAGPTVSWGAEDTLWITVAGTGEDATTGSYTGVGATVPANYSNAVNTGISGDVVGGVDASVAFRQLNATSDDPGAWSAADVTQARNSAFTIAVRPAAAAVGGGTSYYQRGRSGLVVRGRR